MGAGKCSGAGEKGFVFFEKAVGVGYNPTAYQKRQYTAVAAIMQPEGTPMMKSLYMPTVAFILLASVAVAIGCTPKPCAERVDAETAPSATLPYYSFETQSPESGFCEKQVFGTFGSIAEPVNVLFALSTLVLGLFGLFRSKSSSRFVQLLYALLVAYGLFAAAYHITLENGFYRMMDVVLGYLQSFIIVLLVSALGIARRPETSLPGTPVGILQNITIVVFTLYGAVVHVAGESSPSPWVAWLSFDLLWLLIFGLLIAIWTQRKKWISLTADNPIFRLAWMAIGSCVLAYAAWSLDKFVCSCETPGLAYLSLHGIWHLFMGYCLFTMIQLGSYFIAARPGDTLSSPAFP